MGLEADEVRFGAHHSRPTILPRATLKIFLDFPLILMNVWTGAFLRYVDYFPHIYYKLLPPTPQFSIQSCSLTPKSDKMTSRSAAASSQDTPVLWTLSWVPLEASSDQSYLLPSCLEGPCVDSVPLVILSTWKLIEVCSNSTLGSSFSPDII